MRGLFRRCVFPLRSAASEYISPVRHYCDVANARRDQKGPFVLTNAYLFILVQFVLPG